MDKILEEKLFKKYPQLFPNGRNVDPKESLMCFGIETRNGWYELIEKTLEKITKEDKEKIVTIVQLKEKYGGLRIYIRGGNEKIFEIINEAEKKSIKTCELCGKKGKQDNKERIITLCEKCKAR